MSPEERQQRASEQEQRALETLQAIWTGGDLGEETLKLSNEFTDRHVGRFTAWVRALFTRRPR